METKAPSAKRRGKPAGIPPSHFRHELMLARLNSNRNLHVRSLCRRLKISHVWFYNVVYGRVPAYRNMIVKIAEALGLTEADVLSDQKNSEKILA